MNSLLLRTALATMLACGGAAASAAPVVGISTNEDNPVPDPVVSFDVFSNLAGAIVSFNGASTVWGAGSNPLWNPTGGGTNCGGAILGGFSLGGCGDTFSNLWYQANNATAILTEVVVDLTPTHSFFDRTEPSPGTFDSAAGRDYTYVGDTVAGGYGGQIDVVYSIPGISPPEDLYKVMLIDYSGLTSAAGNGGILPGTEITYEQDTDPIPLPAGAWLLITGGAALVALRRRKAS